MKVFTENSSFLTSFFKKHLPKTPLQYDNKGSLQLRMSDVNNYV